MMTVDGRGVQALSSSQTVACQVISQQDPVSQQVRAPEVSDVCTEVVSMVSAPTRPGRAIGVTDVPGPSVSRL